MDFSLREVVFPLVHKIVFALGDFNDRLSNGANTIFLTLILLVLGAVLALLLWKKILSLVAWIIKAFVFAFVGAITLRFVYSHGQSVDDFVEWLGNATSLSA